MNFRQLKLNNLNGDTKLRKKTIFNSGIFVFQTPVLNQLRISKKIKNIIHSFESQHFKLNVGFFFSISTEH